MFCPTVLILCMTINIFLCWVLRNYFFLSFRNFIFLIKVCIEKVKALMSSGRLTGVLDDRGKVIHITNDEYEAVAQYIEKCGRITLSELVENGHKLIRTGPNTSRG
ncbi:unnamed protein product [Schistosoma margrebowiei]|uniref:DDRGK domain-containing protein 1 n=1 Tax=Schistosoma margrebowiei TaxID=48269 RepID=A0A183MBA3_9TREM|nr:unnamed protein product [Schistosoma margrebowiei]